ncbi:hypothetical protein GCM10009693_21450 [Leucobacter chromiireducens subsp. chromiireducens]
MGVVPESIAPQEEMYPFVPGCGSTQPAGMKAAWNRCCVITVKGISAPCWVTVRLLPRLR